MIASISHLQSTFYLPISYIYKKILLINVALPLVVLQSFTMNV